MTIEGVDVLFVAGFGPVVSDPQASMALYRDTIGLPLEAMPGNGDYVHTDKLKGVNHFALWPLSGAAESCFGTTEWPDSHPVPHAWLEFEVADIASATEALKAKDYDLLVEARLEPWGQTVTRLLAPEGMLVGLTITPWLRER